MFVRRMRFQPGKPKAHNPERHQVCKLQIAGGAVSRMQQLPAVSEFRKLRPETVGLLQVEAQKNKVYTLQFAGNRFYGS